MARKKKQKINSVLILALVMFLIIGSVAVWLYNRNVPAFVRYPAFGIDMPIHFDIHGIDVSKYQQAIDWEEVKMMEVDALRISFAFMKATEGLGNVDGYFKRNWNKSKQAGLSRGAYHFFIATKSGKEQAKHFISTVELESGDLPPVLDVEQTYGVADELLRERVTDFLEAVSIHYGVTPIIYTNVDFYNRHLGKDFEDYPLWVAHYLQKNKPRINRKWVFWQHSEQGRVNGIRNKVDFNVFNGNDSDFQQLLIP